MTEDAASAFLADPSTRRDGERVVRAVCRARSVRDEDDVVQEVFMRALSGSASFRGSTKPQFLAWLKTIARHHVADIWRDEGRQTKVSLEDEPEAPVQPLSRERAREVMAAVGRLPPEDQAILRAHYERGIKLKHIAQTLGMSAAAMRQRHRRLLARLRGPLSR